MTASVSKKFRLGAVTSSLAAALWIAGLVSYAEQVPREVEDATSRTDAIVVLTGGSGRVETGIALLANGLAERLFISGVGPAVNADTLVATDQPERDVLIAKITVGAEAEDTPGNAVETAKWARQNGVKSIRLVTAAYHMPRGLRELEQTMADITLIPHPVFPDQVKAEWWRYPGTAGLLSREYAKYLAASVRLYFSARRDT